MLDVSKDIHSLTEFKTRTPEFLAELRESGRAVLLTINGRAELAVMSSSTFQRVLEALDLLESLQGLQSGVEDLEAGRTRPAAEAFRDLRRRRGLSESGE